MTHCQLFIVECRELLEDMETALLAVEQAEEKTRWSTPSSAPRTPSRARQGLFSLDHMVAFTHVVESVLDRCAAASWPGPTNWWPCCWPAATTWCAGRRRGRRRDRARPSCAGQGEPLVAQLACLPERCRAAPAQAVPVPTGAEADTVRRINGTRWTPTTGTSRCALAPTCCATAWTRCRSSATWAPWAKSPPWPPWPTSLPDAATMDPELCYLGFEIAFRAATSTRPPLKGV
jgi:two-component system chemotaxis sensor kinase CheA